MKPSGKYTVASAALVLSIQCMSHNGGGLGIISSIGADAFVMPSSSMPMKTKTRSTLLGAAESDEISALESKRKEWSRPDLAGTSLLPTTLSQLETDEEFQSLTKKIAEVGIEGMTREERAKRRRALEDLGVPNFMQFVLENDVANSNTAVQNKQLFRSEPTILQLNIGLYCNQACSHCHVESSPLRQAETMSPDIAARCLQLLQSTPSIHTLDLTGGAPELNEQFRFLVKMARNWAKDNNRTLKIIDRCNLTVLMEPDQSGLVDFLKEHEVNVVASLPCYGEDNVDAQRGRGVFQRSIAALLKLNEAGYGTPDHPELSLDLVYNPSGAFLPPSQSSLQEDYKVELLEKFGITFDGLLTITNMPIKRFADYLAKEGKMKEYMELLVDNFNGDTVGGLMCLDTVSVGWDGMIYDCDFNQQLGMGIIGQSQNKDESNNDAPCATKKQKLSVFDIESLMDLQKYAVRTDNHCFGCTAGSGSSCQGATA